MTEVSREPLAGNLYIKTAVDIVFADGAPGGALATKTIPSRPQYQ